MERQDLAYSMDYAVMTHTEHLQPAGWPLHVS